jgi:hypothetical protein
MKKSIITLFLVALAIFSKSFGQEKTKKESDIYFWFEIKIESVIHDDTKKPSLLTNRIFKTINSGSFIEFAISFKENLKSNKIVIGPFINKETAKLAQKCYKISKFSSYEASEKFINDFKPVKPIHYFYFSKPKFDGDGTLLFERMPARVTNGTIKEFLQIVSEGLSYNLLAMGPFTNQLNGEKSKYVFRKYGEFGSSDKENDKAPANLKVMAKNWENVKVEIKKMDDENVDNMTTLVVKINFPPKYFKRDAVQHIEIATMNEVQETLGGFTFQGEEYRDNNPVVSFEYGSSYEFKLKNVN